MHGEEQTEDEILTRARKAIAENDLAYARFLYCEALAVNPQNNAARAELHKLRETAKGGNSFANAVKFAYYASKIFFHRAVAKYDKIIDDAENLLNVSPTSRFGFRAILHAAHDAGYYKLAIFVAEKIKGIDSDTGDLLAMARAYLNEKIFDKSAKIAKEISEMDPENEEAKDLLWKSSVEKHMNTEVTLVTAGGDRRFVPPKIDSDKIFIASHKDEKKDDKK
jgi:tetratricopeptide (TPR) repeat protein